MNIEKTDGLLLLLRISTHCHESPQMTEVEKLPRSGENALEKTLFELGHEG